MQGLCFNISLLFLHTKDSGYKESPLLNTLVIHGMIGTFTAMLTKREGKSHFQTINFVLSFIVSVSDSIIMQITMKYFKLPKRWDFLFLFWPMFNDSLSLPSFLIN